MAAEHDLLASILISEGASESASEGASEGAYPWEPLAPEAEGYLASLETEFGALDDGDLTAAIAAGWQILESQMTALATAQQSEAEIAVAAAPILGQLRQFQTRMPGGLLQSLATAATALSRSGQPLIDQLVHCVNDILPGWDAADLAVLARPLAYSLRDGRGEIVDLNLRAISDGPWETLSEVEQARLTLTVASVALKAAQAGDRPEGGSAGNS
ncbi:MAG: hypothetical protein DCF21_00625 [Leptolyngbya sp.]|nr:MAG: hypothetical protein DCF21_00625 [Leptolyngbya sp.]